MLIGSGCSTKLKLQSLSGKHMVVSRWQTSIGQGYFREYSYVLDVYCTYSQSVLNKNRKCVSSFYGQRKRKRKETPLVKWAREATPKEARGWGLKNIYVFKMALLAKSLWMLIYNEDYGKK